MNWSKKKTFLSVSLFNNVKHYYVGVSITLICGHQHTEKLGHHMVYLINMRIKFACVNE